MDIVEKITLLSAGLFFLTGLLTGVLKYRQIMTSENAQAHPYIDVCHRASLLYAFAAILLLKFVEISRLPTTLELIAVCAILVYFASAILTYLVHGLLRDTENQLKPPFRVGSFELPRGAVPLHMWMLIVAETGGFLVLFYGVLIEVL